MARRKEKSLRVRCATNISPPAPNAVTKVALSIAPGALRIGDVEQGHENQRFRNHVRAVGEVLHADRGAGLRGARGQPARQHEGAENQEPIEAEHELRDLPREAGLEQRQLDQNEPENAARPDGCRCA